MVSQIKKFQITGEEAKLLDIEDGKIKFRVKNINEDRYEIINSIPLEAVNNKIEVLSSKVSEEDVEWFFRHRNHLQVKYDAVQELDFRDEFMTSEEFNLLHEFVKSCKNLEFM